MSGKYKKKNTFVTYKKHLIILLLFTLIFLGCFSLLLYHYASKNSSDIFIHTSEDAIYQLNQLSGGLGYNNAFSELSEKNTTTIDNDTYYRLQQNYHGIPVYGKTVVCTTDENGRVTSITGNMQDVNSSIDIAPSISSQEISTLIDDFFTQESITFSSEDLETITLQNDILCIFYPRNSEEAYLAYRINLLGYEILIEAHSPGKILMINDLVRSAESIQKDLSGQRQTYQNVAFLKEQETYSLVDPSNIIKTYLMNNETHFVWRKKDWPRFIKVWDANDSQILKWTEPEIPSASAVDAFVNTQIAYNFFKETLGNSSTDGNGLTEIHVEIGLEWLLVSDGTERNLQNNACSFTDTTNMPITSYLCFNEGTNKNISYSADLDIVAHEYTHAVETLHSGMIYEGESGSIMEGLCDIFGELVEAWHSGNSSDWQNSPRNIMNPTESKNPSEYYGSFWGNTANHSIDKGYVHNNSTVISHAAYLMSDQAKNNSSSGLTNSELSKLWYRAMLMMPSDCNFYECRKVVELAASSMNLSPTKRASISNAFDSVGILNYEKLSVDYPVSPNCQLSVFTKDGEPYDDFTIVISEHGANDLLGNESTPSFHRFDEYQSAKSVSTTESFKLPAKEGIYSIEIIDNTNNKALTSCIIEIKKDNTKSQLELFTSAEKPLIVKITDQETGNINIDNAHQDNTELSKCFLPKANRAKSILENGLDTLSYISEETRLESINYLTRGSLIDWDHDGNDELFLSYCEPTSWYYTEKIGLYDIIDGELVVLAEDLDTEIARWAEGQSGKSGIVYYNGRPTAFSYSHHFYPVQSPDKEYTTIRCIIKMWDAIDGKLIHRVLISCNGNRLQYEIDDAIVSESDFLSLIESCSNLTYSPDAPAISFDFTFDTISIDELIAYLSQFLSSSTQSVPEETFEKRLVAIHAPQSIIEEINISYNSSGNIASVKERTNWGSELNYEYRYNENGNISEIWDMNLNYSACDFQYDLAGNLVYISDGINGKTTTYSYDHDGKVTQKITSASSSPIITTFIYNEEGKLYNAVSMIDSVEFTNSFYDSEERLVEENAIDRYEFCASYSYEYPPFVLQKTSDSDYTSITLYAEGVDIPIWSTEEVFVDFNRDDAGYLTSALAENGAKIICSYEAIP